MANHCDKPLIIDAKAGRFYWWCRCGQSARMPLCDGAHQGTEIEPVVVRAERTGPMALCGCQGCENPMVEKPCG